MTYAYYQANVKSAPVKKAAGGWRCKVCGYVYEGETLPDNFECPICHHGADDFERIEEPAKEASPRWVCSVCGYVHEGAEPPEECPICHVPKEKFSPYDGK